jgi:hypothetical protein
MALEWVQVRGQAWQQRLAGWLQNTGCDAWILRDYVQDAAMYAEERIEKLMPSSEQVAAARFEEWMTYYRARQVEEVHGGVLAMRRRSGTNWVWIEEMSGAPSQPFGESVLETFANYDALSSHLADWQLLALKPRLALDARLEQQFQVEDGKWVPAAAKISRTTGLSASLEMDPVMAEFLSRCDGQRTLRQLIPGLAMTSQVNPGQVQQQCCAMVRKLLERRLLLV